MKIKKEKDSPVSIFDQAGVEREKRRRKQQKWKSLIAVLATLLIFMVFIYVSTALLTWLDGKLTDNVGDLAIAMGGKDPNAVETAGQAEQITYTQEELDEQIRQAVAAAEESAREAEADRILGTLESHLSNGDTVVETLRLLYPDDLVVYSGGAYRFVTIREDLLHNDYHIEQLNALENGRYEYVEEGQTVSYMGIDVSKHQGEIDWEKVAADGVDFAFIRVGIRGYGTGRIVEDEYFEENIKGALQNGIKVGVYFFSQAITEEEAVEEAEFVLERIAPYRVECPVVFDVEKLSDSSARMNALTAEERTAVTLAFLQTIEKEGYKTMIYHNMETSTVLLNLDQLEQYDKWFAYYNDDFYYPYQYKVWQYSESGSVDGISAAVDLDIAFEPLWE